VGGEVCVSNDSQRLLAAAETKNNGRGAQQQLRRGPWFVFLCFICQTLFGVLFVNQQIIEYRTYLLCMMSITFTTIPGRIGGTTSSFPGRDKRKVNGFAVQNERPTDVRGT
jgi:hypothetical protein